MRAPVQLHPFRSTRWVSMRLKRRTLCHTLPVWLGLRVVRPSMAVTAAMPHISHSLCLHLRLFLFLPFSFASMQTNAGALSLRKACRHSTAKPSSPTQAWCHDGWTCPLHPCPHPRLPTPTPAMVVAMAQMQQQQQQRVRAWLLPLGQTQRQGTRLNKKTVVMGMATTRMRRMRMKFVTLILWCWCRACTKAVAHAGSRSLSRANVLLS